jgi:hypothetical protein
VFGDFTVTSPADRTSRNDHPSIIASLLCLFACLFITLLPALVDLSDTGGPTPPQSPAPIPAPIPTPTSAPETPPTSAPVSVQVSVPSSALTGALDMRCSGGEGPVLGVERALCEANSWVARTVTGIGNWVALGWPLAALATLTTLIAALLGFARAIARLKAAEGAQWLEITPPATPTSAAALWRMFDGCLRLAPRARPWKPRPQMAAEWWADPAGLRAGVWVPPAIRPERVAEAIGRAWPGATVRPTHPPIWQRYPTRLLELAPTGGPWAPLIDPTSRPGGVDQASDEPLRAVLGALADLAPGEQASVQLVVSAHPHPLAGAGLGGGVSGVLRAAVPALLGSLAGAVAAVAVMLLDLLTGSPTTSRRDTTSHRGRSAAATSGDPVVSAARSAEAAKRAAGPHLRATLRIAVSVPMPRDWRHDRARAVDIAAGYQLITHGLRPRWRRRWVPEQVTLRTHSRRHAWVATLPELTALWHVPAEPTRYRLAAPGITEREHRGATRFLPDHPTHPHTDTHTDTHTGTRRPGTGRPDTPGQNRGQQPPPPDTHAAPVSRVEHRANPVPTARPPSRPGLARRQPGGPARWAPPAAVSRFSRPARTARSGRAREGGEHR